MTEHDPRATPEPTYDAPFTVALNDMTGFDYLAIKEHFKAPYENLSGSERICGVVWVMENRRVRADDPHASVSWHTVESKSMRELSGYFQPEPPKAKSDKDSEPGK